MLKEKIALNEGSGTNSHDDTEKDIKLYRRKLDDLKSKTVKKAEQLEVLQQRLKETES